MKRYLWASNHDILPEQREELEKLNPIVILEDYNRDLHDRLCNSSSDIVELKRLANELIEFCLSNKFSLVQPAGSLAFQNMLGNCNVYYKDNGTMNSIKIYYAHSERVSTEEIQPDGSVVKKSVFKHQKFVIV